MDKTNTREAEVERAIASGRPLVLDADSTEIEAAKQRFLNAQTKLRATQQSDQEVQR